MRVYSYVVDHDLGFAPNPFHGRCSLAACKPAIRKHAQIGDLIVGTGSKPNGIVGRVSYWMLVDEIVDFNLYWLDVRFSRKRPMMNGSLSQIYGDNIYHRETDDSPYLQENSFHSNADGSLNLPNWQRDTGTTDRVLLASAYAFWGRSGPVVPPELFDLVHGTQGHRCRFAPDRVLAFSEWLQGMPFRGCLGNPSNWPSAPH